MTRGETQVTVTGSGGFIGRHLVATLQGAGYEVSGWDRGSGDLTDAGQTKELLARDKPQIIFHLATAGARPGTANAPEAVTTNVAMAVNIVDAAAPGTVIVMAGTMSEYGRAGVLTESDAWPPNTAYAIGKFVSGAYGLAYGPKRGVVVRAARLFGAFGPGEHRDRLFPSLVRELRAGRPVPLSDGLQRRDFVHVGDIAEGLMRIAEVGSSESFLVNVGTGQAVAVGDVCRWVAESLGASESLLRFGARERSPGGDADLLEAHTARLSGLLGWVPSQRLRPGLDHGLLG